MRYLNLRKQARRQCRERWNAILDGAVEKGEDGTENVRMLTEGSAPRSTRFAR